MPKLSNFFDKSRLISDNELQDLWSRVLAGEANLPGSYSKRTINLLASLDKSDADLFTHLCGFAWQINGVVPLIYDHQNEIYNKFGINFNTLSHLAGIGLVQQLENLGGYQFLRLPKNFVVFYYGKLITLELPKETDNSLGVGVALLTKIGKELAPICGSQPVEGFFEFICDKWKNEGFIKAEEPPQDIQLPIEAE